MKDGKAEVVGVQLEEGMVLRVTCKTRADCEAYIRVMRKLTPPKTHFEIVSDTVVRCIPPR